MVWFVVSTTVFRHLLKGCVGRASSEYISWNVRASMKLIVSHFANVTGEEDTVCEQSTEWQPCI